MEFHEQLARWFNEARTAVHAGNSARKAVVAASKNGEDLIASMMWKLSQPTGLAATLHKEPLPRTETGNLEIFGLPVIINDSIPEGFMCAVKDGLVTLIPLDQPVAI